MAKNRRLSKASPTRYMLKRIWINTGVATRLAVPLTGSGKVQDAIVLASQQEMENWYTNYQLYHEIKQIVKSIADQKGIPSRWQGLLMAFGEKIVANILVDYKGESLSAIFSDYLRALANYTGGTARYTVTFKDQYGKTYTVNWASVLYDIAKAIYDKFNAKMPTAGPGTILP